MTVITEKQLDDIRAALTERCLFERATMDTIEAMMRFAVVGHSIPRAITELDRLRAQFERQTP